MSHSILEGYYIEILYRESTYTITDSTVLSNKSREARGSKGCSIKGLRSKVARYTESKGLIELMKKNVCSLPSFSKTCKCCYLPLTTSSVVAASSPARLRALQVYSSASANWMLLMVSVFSPTSYLLSPVKSLIPRAHVSSGGGKPLAMHFNIRDVPFKMLTRVPMSTVRGLSLFQITSSKERLTEGGVEATKTSHPTFQVRHK